MEKKIPYDQNKFYSVQLVTDFFLVMSLCRHVRFLKIVAKVAQFVKNKFVFVN